ncbi:MAG: arginine--tRNA ligase [Candidatus Dojkabacteria bacterium]|nr:arginine--tRNA ligase [Candidatus Dojkabacteria bacterium]
MIIKQLTNLELKNHILFKIKNLLIEYININSDTNQNLDENEINVYFNQEKNKKTDISTTISFKLAKIFKKSPILIAQEIALFFQNHGFDASAENGYVNINLDISNVYDELMNLENNLSSTKPMFDLGKNKKVFVEFCSPNAFKSLTVGHLRNTITGHAIARMIENLGFDVVRMNYYSDMGLHIAKTIWALKQENIDVESEEITRLDEKEKMKLILGLYVKGNDAYGKNENIKKEIDELNYIIYKKTDQKVNKIFDILLSWSLDHILNFLKFLNIDEFDKHYSESEAANHANELISKFIGDIFIEDQGSIIYRDSNGITQVYINSRGIPTYGAKDFSLAKIKINDFGLPEFSIVLTSVEQNDYFKNLIEAINKAFEELNGRYYHIGYGWVLGPDGKKTSTRLGNAKGAYDLISEAIEEAKNKIAESKTYTQQEIDQISYIVGIAGLKFFFLSHELQNNLIFNPKVFLSFDGFSGPYILYSFVRARNIISNAEKISKHIDTEKFTESEIELLKKLYQFTNIVFEATVNIEPHHIARYLYDIAVLFNEFYKNNRVIDEDKVYIKRLNIVRMYSKILEKGLYLLGIDTIDKM